MWFRLELRSLEMERIIPAEKGHFIIFRLLLAEVFGASSNGLGIWNWIGDGGNGQG